MNNVEERALTRVERARVESEGPRGQEKKEALIDMADIMGAVRK